MKKYILGVDGGNTKTDYFLFDIEGNFIDFERCGTCSHEGLADSFEGSYRVMKKDLQPLLDRNNLKASDMQAAIGCAQLDKITYFVQQRKVNFQYLYDNLKDIPQISLMEKYSESDPSWFGFLITLTSEAKFSRNDLAQYLENSRIQTRNLFAGNILRHPCFADLRKDIDYRVIGELNNTDKIMRDSFWIGVYPGMSLEKLQYMVEIIRNYVAQS